MRIWTVCLERCCTCWDDPWIGSSMVIPIFSAVNVGSSWNSVKYFWICEKQLLFEAGCILEQQFSVSSKSTSLLLFYSHIITYSEIHFFLPSAWKGVLVFENPNCKYDTVFQISMTWSCLRIFILLQIMRVHSFLFDSVAILGIFPSQWLWAIGFASSNKFKHQLTALKTFPFYF